MDNISLFVSPLSTEKEREKITLENMIVPQTSSIIYQEPFEEKKIYSKWAQNNIVNF